MLPSLLSEHLCSLRSGVERYAVSVVWTLKEGREGRLEVVGDPWFGRSIIRSRHQLHYQQAQVRGPCGSATLVCCVCTALYHSSTTITPQPSCLSLYQTYTAERVLVSQYLQAWLTVCHLLTFTAQMPHSCYCIPLMLWNCHRVRCSQDVLDGVLPAPGDELPPGDLPTLREGLHLLRRLTHQLHARRVADGALELESAELRFKVTRGGGRGDAAGMSMSMRERWSRQC
jgi:hypothetical protein